MSRHALGCEQCGGQERMRYYRDGKLVPRPRERSRCCRMLLCSSCIKVNGYCFACETIEERTRRETNMLREQITANAPQLLSGLREAVAWIKASGTPDEQPTLLRLQAVIRRATTLPSRHLPKTPLDTSSPKV